jgi:hypothetical protein
VDDISKKTFDFQGRKVTGQEINFESKGENWNIYLLEDGTKLRVKLVVLDVARLDEYNNVGEPLYQFRAQQLVNVEVPDNLKKKAQ